MLAPHYPDMLPAERVLNAGVCHSDLGLVMGGRAGGKACGPGAISAWLSSPRKETIVSLPLEVIAVFVTDISTSGAVRPVCSVTVHQKIRKTISPWLPRLSAKLSLVCDAQKTQPGLGRTG